MVAGQNNQSQKSQGQNSQCQNRQRDKCNVHLAEYIIEMG